MYLCRSQTLNANNLALVCSPSHPKSWSWNTGRFQGPNLWSGPKLAIAAAVTCLEQCHRRRKSLLCLRVVESSIGADWRESRCFLIPAGRSNTDSPGGMGIREARGGCNVGCMSQIETQAPHLL